MSKSETIIFNGIKFRRYPDSKRSNHRNYFSPSGTYIKRGIKSLHIEIWKTANGAISDGQQIHHAAVSMCCQAHLKNLTNDNSHPNFSASLKSRMASLRSSFVSRCKLSASFRRGIKDFANFILRISRGVRSSGFSPIRSSAGSSMRSSVMVSK